jgi:Fe-S cluster assembly protein SufD
MSLVSDSVFEAHLASFVGMPEWLIEMKREAWTRYKALPMPVRKSEAWRFATTDNLVLDGFSHEPLTEMPEQCERPLVNCGGCLDFADDVYVGGKALDETLSAKGVIFMPLDRALREHSELVRAHLFERMPDLGSEKFQALHVALFSTGVFLYVPRGVHVELPLAGMHEALRDGDSVFPHTLVVADEGASVTMFDVYRSRDDAAKNFVCAAADVYAMPGANVRYRMVQAWSQTSLAFHLNSTTADKGSAVDSITINLGGAHIRGEQHGRIVGRGGDVRMHSLSLAGGDQEIDQRTLQTHGAEDGHSDLLYKNVLMGKAHTIFSGMIHVDADAQRTDAYQTNRNLLLSPDAEADSLPGLEILANDVKCSHGTSTGQLDETQLFYLLARGIPRRKAQELMVFGFFEEVLARFGNEDLAGYVRGLLTGSFSL